jgi:hypothetical protein
MPDSTVEDRLTRLEQLVDRVIAYARTSALGRAILARLDLP